MLNRSREAFLHLWRAATNIKTLIEWLIIAGALGVPGVSAAIALYYGQTSDVVFLYLLAGIAFWYAVKEQLGSELTARFAPVCVIWDAECAGCDNSPVQFTRDLYLGLRNSRAMNARNVVITVASLKPKLGFAFHFVPQPLTGIGDLRPSGESHVQHVKFLHDAPTHPEGPAMVLYVSTTGPLRIPHAEYTGTLIVQADDVWPRNYQFEIARHEGVMSLTLQDTR